MPKTYRSQIPAHAREKIVERHDDGAPSITEYYPGRERVGVRHWEDLDYGGDVIWDIPFRNGVKDGLELTFYSEGRIASVEPYVGGLVHGTAKQFAPDGRLLGTYRLKRGIGVDLWRDCITGKLREEWHCVDGSIVFGRVWNGDDRTIWQEYYCRTGHGYHGVLREWNDAGRLRRGFPQFYVRGKKVTRRQYLQACEGDSSLPDYIPAEDTPFRKLPAEYLAQVKRIRNQRNKKL